MARVTQQEAAQGNKDQPLAPRGTSLCPQQGYPTGEPQQGLAVPISTPTARQGQEGLIEKRPPTLVSVGRTWHTSPISCPEESTQVPPLTAVGKWTFGDIRAPLHSQAAGRAVCSTSGDSVPGSASKGSPRGLAPGTSNPVAPLPALEWGVHTCLAVTGEAGPCPCSRLAPPH